MAKKYSGGAGFGFSLNFTSGVPADLREYVNTVSDLYDPATWTAKTYNAEDDSKNVYVLIPSQRVSVHNEKTIYQFTADTATKDTIKNPNNWMRIANVDDIQRLGSALEFKGSVDSLTTLNAKTNPAIGDMWNINQPYKVNLYKYGGSTEYGVVAGTNTYYEIPILTSDGNKSKDSVRFETRTYKNVVYCVFLNSSNEIYVRMTNDSGLNDYYTKIGNESAFLSMISHYEGAILAPYTDDASIQGMNFACIARCATFKTKVYEEDTYTGKSTSNDAITGEVFFHDGYAYVKVTSGTTVTTYYYNSTDDVLVPFTTYGNDYATTPVYGEWDAMGSDTTNVARVTDLTGGTLAPAKAKSLATKRKIDGVYFNGTEDIHHKTTASLITGTNNLSEGNCLYNSTETKFSYGDGHRYYVKFDTDCPTNTTPYLYFGSMSDFSVGKAKKITLSGTTFNTIKAGIYYQLLYDGTNWEVVGGAGSGISDEQSNILDQFAEVKVDDDTISGITKPYDMDICPTINNVFSDGMTTNNAYVLYKQMYADMTSASQRPKLKFLLFNGQKSKFDIDGYDSSTLTITFSFVNQGKFFRAKLKKTDANATSAKINWVCYNADLASVLSVATIVASQQQSIAALDERTTWYKLS